jgi:hypothetical protein
VTANGEQETVRLTVPSDMILCQHLLERYEDTYTEILLSRQTNSGHQSKPVPVKYEAIVPTTQTPILQCHVSKEYFIVIKVKLWLLLIQTYEI